MDNPTQGNDGIPTSQELMEIYSSPDPFSESSHVSHAGGGDIIHEKSSQNLEDSDELQEVLTMSDCPSTDKKTDLGAGESSNWLKDDEFIPWRGCPLSELQKGATRFGMPQMHPIKPSSYHTVLFQVPGSKEPYPAPLDAWDGHHVRLPCSPSNLYPVGDSVKPRWEIIKSALQRPIENSKDLERAIMSYNRTYANRWNFTGLHEFFNEIIEEEEKSCFFVELLPQMVELALLLPCLITRPIPLLRQHQNRSISFSQRQAACLLANAFFCTFPRRNAAKQTSEYSSFPDINFNKLFQEQKKKIYKRRTHEKLKCLFHYFRRVCHKPPPGSLTFTRQYVTPSHIPTWEYSSHYFRKLHVASKGTIEDYGKGMLQVDFANKMVGGGVLGWGCVQEEIRFVICPELIVARLFTESLAPTEALLITGAEQFSSYEGYADTFMWDGDYQDDTPRDSSGRMLCTVVAIDALSLRSPNQQYNVDNIIRESNKAYAGFLNMDVSNDNLSAVATGNWGCGVYRGNPQLKALIQLLAAAQTGRSVAYFTFGNIHLRDKLANLHKFLIDNRATVGLVWRHMCQYYEQCYRNGSFVMDLYDFIHKSMDPTYTVKLSPVKGRKALISPKKFFNISPTKASPDKKESGKVTGFKKQEVKEKTFRIFSMRKNTLSKNTVIQNSARRNLNRSNSNEGYEAVRGKSGQSLLKTVSEAESSGIIGHSSPIKDQTSLRGNSNPNKKAQNSLCSTKSIDFSAVTLTSLPGSPKVLLMKPDCGIDSASDNDLLNIHQSSDMGKPSNPAIQPRVPLHFITKKKTPVKPTEDSKEVFSNWLEEYEKKELETSTIQTRISDYFYEINIPK